MEVKISMMSEKIVERSFLKVYQTTELSEKNIQELMLLYLNSMNSLHQWRREKF